MVSRRYIGGMVCCIAAVQATSAAAACWVDERLQSLAWQVAGQHFPLARQRMPKVLMCSGDEFPARVGGDYTSVIHRIRVPSWLDQGHWQLVLAHELGHAEVALSGADRGADGHGPGWVAVMERAGLGDEVKRMAQYSASAALVLAQRGQARASPGHQGGAVVAGLSGNGRPSLPSVLKVPPTSLGTCYLIMMPVYEPGVIQMQPRKVCPA